MIMTCPSCGTRYRVEPEALGDHGRTVRCAGCGHLWFVAVEASPEPPKAATDRDVASPPSAMPPPLAEPTPAMPPAGAAVRRSPVGWLVLVLMTLMLTAAAVGRDDIAEAFPQAIPIYRRLGLPVTLEIGLELRDVAVEHATDAAGALLVTGEIRNVSGGQRLVPGIRIGLLDEARHEVASQVFDPPQKVLAVAGSVRFEARIAAPPAAARDVAITFSDRP